jgi:hypothetical protein
LQSNSRLLVFGCSDSQIRVWNAESREEGLPVEDSGLDCSVGELMVITAIRKNKYPSLNLLHFSSQATLGSCDGLEDRGLVND